MFEDRPWIEKHTILRVEVGSGVHGLAIAGGDDRDEMGVCLEPLEWAFGTTATFDTAQFRTAAERTGDTNARSEPGDLDLVIYSLRKWIRLALQGNPTVLTLLFAPRTAVARIDARGQALRDLAPAFASRAAAGRFLGYLAAQRQRVIDGRGRLDRHTCGYDAKAAAHMLRLGYQGIEYLETGRITLPLLEPIRQRCLAVKQGTVDQQEVVDEAQTLTEAIEQLKTTSPLPPYPDALSVETWMLDTYLEFWKATYGHRRYLDKLGDKIADRDRRPPAVVG